MRARRVGSPLVCWAVLAGALVGCTRPRPPVPAAEDAGPPPPRPTGVRLPVPSGWTVSTAADGSLRIASAPGHGVMRAELRRGVGMPTVETLRTGFAEGLRRMRVRRLAAVDEAGYVALRLAVADGSDGGTDEPMYLGALQLGGDTLLCASVRGASAPEIEEAERACRGAEHAEHLDAGAP